MITKKRMEVPIFNYKLTIVIFDDWNELKGYIPDDELEQSGNGITIEGYGSPLVAIDARSRKSIYHEALHIVNFIWRHIGYEPSRDNDEVSAYLLAYLSTKIEEVYYRHVGKELVR